MEQIRINGYSDHPIPYLNLDNHKCNEDVKRLISKSYCKKFSLVPIDLIGNILTVGIEKPNLDRINLLQKKTKKVVRVFRSRKEEINSYIENLYSKTHSKESEYIKWEG